MKRAYGFLLALCFATAAHAQNAGTVTNHAFAIGKGPGVAGYSSLLCGSAQLALGTGSGPACVTVSGDATLSAAGVLTLATVNTNVGTFGSAAQCLAFTVNAKGLVTAASAATCTPAIGSVTGLATGVAAWLAVPSSANLRAATTDETGTGLLYFQGGDIGTPSAGVGTNLSGTAASLTAGHVTTNANLTGDVTSTGNATTYNNVVPRAKGGGATSVAGEQAALASGLLVYTLAGANFNSTADQPIAISLPTGFTRYRVQGLLAGNPSVSLTTAVGGIYTAASKGGIAVVAASQAYSFLTTNTVGANGSLGNVPVTNQSTAFYSSTTLFLSLTTPQGAAATADIAVFIQPLP